ncbi:DNA gyrase inhibitor YacG [Undibacterium squillarum]|uniref:DNA gyrase inhibitor YacG n=1 Tax=Undibacterium squillarum TaxID=1131567 RepID=A0ABQ2Y0I7_9BURK|nr:DNA gyrase inhibitor YacG [Undibacterium squillarum]GGX45601.1 DNA gyrase inhibitor YacG [Undibacterium squillarum]
MATVVQCPCCKKDVPWTPESLWRPFCSERCKQTDLGAWAQEKYSIPSTTQPDPGELPPELQ